MKPVTYTCTCIVRDVRIFHAKVAWLLFHSWFAFASVACIVVVLLISLYLHAWLYIYVRTYQFDKFHLLSCSLHLHILYSESQMFMPPFLCSSLLEHACTDFLFCVHNYFQCRHFAFSKYGVLHVIILFLNLTSMSFQSPWAFFMICHCLYIDVIVQKGNWHMSGWKGDYSLFQLVCNQMFWYVWNACFEYLWCNAHWAIYNVAWEVFLLM